MFAHRVGSEDTVRTRIAKFLIANDVTEIRALSDCPPPQQWPGAGDMVGEELELLNTFCRYALVFLRPW